MNGVARCLRAYAEFCRSCVVEIQVDNSNVSGICTRGSPKGTLAHIAKDIYRWCRDRQVTLVIKWVPRALNTEADTLSKLRDPDDWYLHPYAFTHVETAWGPFDCDVFASDINHRCPKFFTKFASPGSAGIDAFAQDWSRDFLWVNPPFGAIGRVLTLSLIHI